MLRFLISLIRFALSKIYHRHILYSFPIPVLAQRMQDVPPPKAGYELRVPQTTADYEAWAELLNEDGGFGRWSSERIKSELVSRLVDPRAAVLMFYKGEAVACGCATDASTPRRRIAHGMYLYVRPAHRGPVHRGTKSVAYFVTFRALGFCVEHGYEQVLGATDPNRLSALLLYLSNDGVPVRNSLYSYVQWYRVKKQLSPIISTSARRRLRTASPTAK
jgi:hypothetical protein